MYINHVQLIGNLTRDIELKALPSGVKVATISMATNRTWKDTNGAKQEAVEFHNIVAFGKQAEVLAQYVFKGHQLCVEGRLQTRSWEDKDTQKKLYRTEIVLESFQFGNKPKDGSTSTGTPVAKNATGTDRVEDDAMDTIEYPEEDINPEDIPF